MWKTLGEMGIPAHITCLLRNLRVGQEATQNLIWDNWLVQTEKAAQQGCLLSPCLLNLYTEHIMRNARLDDLQAGIKISGKNIKNLRYADDTTLIAKSKEELKNLLMRVKEENEKKNWGQGGNRWWRLPRMNELLNSTGGSAEVGNYILKWFWLLD